MADGTGDLQARLADSPEARAWLAGNLREAPLASNRFHSTADALAFVERLYAAGAPRVAVDSEAVVDDALEMAEGGPAADTLLVALPPSPPARARLFAIAADEARRDGYAAEADAGQPVLLLWWD